MAIIKSTSARRTSTVKSAASKSASSKTAASKSTSSTSSGTLNSNGYRDNFDYSAAIAGTTDSAKRQQLLSERQNKIDSLGLGGKVASNDAVSTWNGTYRPYSVSSTTTGVNRVSSLYDAAENARFKRFETARSRIARQLESNLASIENDYAAGMRQTDINARQSAVNNEEKLAALGYAQYEISNFARPGFESRHNLKYWTLGEYAGFGPGAHSDFGGVRYAYTRDLEAYIRGVRDHAPMLSESDRIPPLDRDTEWIMLGLRTTAGLDPKVFENRFRRRFSCFLPFLNRWRLSCSATKSAGTLRRRCATLPSRA